MALSIGVSVGDEILVGPIGTVQEYHTIRVKTLTAPNLIVVAVNGGPDVVVSEDQKIEVVPGVKVQVGVGPHGGTNRLAFHADRAIRISRIAKQR